MRSAIVVRNLFFSYGSKPVLNGLCFNIDRGCFFIIIGPNGSGKTTLMNLLCGITKPEKGEIDLLGQPQKKYSRTVLARTVALVPQRIRLDFPFTVQEVVLMGRTPHLGMLGLERSEDLRLARQTMEFTEVHHLAHRTIEQLSGGELQRVSIARAICQQPRIILLDEPTASLDLAHQIRIMDLMERLKQEQGITVVMVSHDINLASMYADCLLMLKQGQIVRTGAPARVITCETIEAVYGCPVLVERSSLDASPKITLIPGKHITKDTHC